MLKFKVKVGRANASNTSYKITFPKKVGEFIDATLGDYVEYELHSDGSLRISKAEDNED